MKILIADDEPTNRMLMALLMRRLGHEVDSVTDGAQLLRRLESEAFDLVFLDIHMPVMDGVEAAKEITRRWGNLSKPILIVVTASDDLRVRQLCTAAGIDDYVLKPVTLQILRNVIDRWRVRPRDPRVVAFPSM